MMFLRAEYKQLWNRVG